MARVETAKSLENMFGSEKRRRTVDNRFWEFERMDVWGGVGGASWEQETKSTGTNPTPHGNTTSDRTAIAAASIYCVYTPL